MVNEILKKQIFFRRLHRGCKELDIILGSFIKKNINRLNSDEVEDWKWMKIEDVKKDISLNPDLYTAWFKIIFKNFYNHLNNSK